MKKATTGRVSMGGAGGRGRVEIRFFYCILVKGLLGPFVWSRRGFANATPPPALPKRGRTVLERVLKRFLSGRNVHGRLPAGARVM